MLVRNATPVADAAPMASAGIAARKLAHRWPRLPYLMPADAVAFADDLAVARLALPAPADPWA